MVAQHYRIDAKTEVLVLDHQPNQRAQGQIVILHGLEGSAHAGYVSSFSQAALDRGFGVHRVNLRTCGGTEHLSETMYHSGLTQDAHVILNGVLERFGTPVFLVGFSLGGNIALKLAGELGAQNALSGVSAISPPIELAACVRAIGRRCNLFYARRFLDRLKSRIRRKSAISPDVYSVAGLDAIKTIWEFDELYTARLFGFGSAARYYETQSAANFLSSIHVSTLLVTAKDDPLIPFSIFSRPEFDTNPNLRLIAPEHGGHLGFISRYRPRFWVEGVILEWMERLLPPGRKPRTHAGERALAHL